MSSISPRWSKRLKNKAIGGAFLDVTTPRTAALPIIRIWSLPPDAHIHHAPVGPVRRTKMFIRSADRFLDNLDKYLRGEPVAPVFASATGLLIGRQPPFSCAAWRISAIHDARGAPSPSGHIAAIAIMGTERADKMYLRGRGALPAMGEFRK